MVRAVGSGNPAPMSSFASLERTLERTVETLMKGAPSSEKKALLIEARRLRSVVANWRSIPPPSDVYDEMLDRVLHLSTAAGASPYEPPPESFRAEFEPMLRSDYEQDLYDDVERTARSGLDAVPIGAVPSRAAQLHDDGPTIPQRRYQIQSHAAPMPVATYPKPGPTGKRVAEPDPVISLEDDEASCSPAADPDEDAPSYPSHGIEDTRHFGVEAIRARYSAPPLAPPPSSYPTPSSHAPPRMPSTPPPARTPSYPPARAPSSPPPMRSGFSTPITGDRLRAQSSPDMGMNGVDDAPIAPHTSVNVTQVQLGEKIDANIVLLSDAYSDRADAYRALRRKLASSGNPQVIAITSPSAGEGRTTCALNLALAMRETSRGKVLLVEANVRSPSIARLLGFETPECFADQLTLRKEDPRKPWSAAEVMPKLHVMACNPAIKRAPQLDPIAFSNGMERLKRAGYEYILIDTPPVLGTFEVNMIADNVDGVLFTAITMRSKRSQLRKAIEQIMPAPVLGVMVLDS